MWAGMSLINDSTLLLVLRHFCYVGRHVSNHFFGTPTSDTSVTWASTSLISALALLLYATTPQYCTVPSGTYCAMSYSFLITGLGILTVIR